MEEPGSQIKSRSPTLIEAIQFSPTRTPTKRLTIPVEPRNLTASTSNPSKTGIMVSGPADPSICPSQPPPSVNGRIKSRGPSGSLDFILEAEKQSPLLAGSALETARSPSPAWDGRLHQRPAASPRPLFDEIHQRDRLGIKEQVSRPLQRVKSLSGLNLAKGSDTTEQATDHYDLLSGQARIIGHDTAPMEPSLNPLDPNMSLGIGSHYEPEGAILQACRDMDSTRRGSSLVSVILPQHANILFSSPCKLAVPSY